MRSLSPIDRVRTRKVYRVHEMLGSPATELLPAPAHSSALPLESRVRSFLLKAESGPSLRVGTRGQNTLTEVKRPSHLQSLWKNNF